jgi:hypothetical protein
MMGGGVGAGEVDDAAGQVRMTRGARARTAPRLQPPPPPPPQHTLSAGKGTACERRERRLYVELWTGGAGLPGVNHRTEQADAMHACCRCLRSAPFDGITSISFRVGWVCCVHGRVWCGM